MSDHALALYPASKFKPGEGFQPGYQFCGTQTARWQQIGNACAPPFVKALVEGLL